jgi:TetR/AcrR family transcriptional repressor of nem operon
MARPKEFIVEEALEKAMEVFWKKGFEGSSFQDICAHTGVQKASLYGAFGDKKALYLAALTMYTEHGFRDMESALESSQDPAEALGEALAHTLSQQKSSTTKGCMCVNAAVELGGLDDEITTALNLHFERMRTLLATTFERGQAVGEFRSEIDPKVAGAFLQVLWYGLYVAARSGQCPQSLIPVAELAVEALVTPTT